MERRTLGPLGEVSALTLGGGGIGAVWGPTTREEAVATLHAAVDAGITVIDSAPGYLACEDLVGEAFEGHLPAGTLLTTKCGVGNAAPGTVAERLRSSLLASLARMRVDRVDAFFLHNPISPALPLSPGEQRRYSYWHTDWAVLVEQVVPALETLVADGLVGHWGLTAVDVPRALVEVVASRQGPAVVQVVSNLLDSPGGLVEEPTDPRPRQIAAAAAAAGVGVMGIRAVQAGALTAGFDREPGERDAEDFRRAAPFRALCASWGEDPAAVAHRYALAMPDVGTVVLGVKNRAELAVCVKAAERGALEPDQVAAVDALGLRG